MRRKQIRCPLLTQIGDRLKAAVIAVRGRLAPSNSARKASTEDQMGQFREQWAQALRSQADVFSGLFTSLERVAHQETGKGPQILREWTQRTRYHWEGALLAELTEQCLGPAAEEGKRARCAQWAGLLLEAAREAGIYQDRMGPMVLGELEAGAYTAWNGEEIYPGDTVEIAVPAWYQAGRVIEQGCARKWGETDGPGGLDAPISDR